MSSEKFMKTQSAVLSREVINRHTERKTQTPCQRQQKHTKPDISSSKETTSKSLWSTLSLSGSHSSSSVYPAQNTLKN